MSTADYAVRWLVPEDAEPIAALEGRVHVSEHRAGGDLIRRQLEITERDGRNLSLGLYSGVRLVGFLLAFVMKDRREMASFFDAPIPPELPPHQSTIYIADWVVDTGHRRASGLMSTKFGQVVYDREDLRPLPVEALATEEYAKKWTGTSQHIAMLGCEYVSRHPFRDRRLGQTLYWLHFTRLPPPTRRDSNGSSIKGRGIETMLVNSPAEWQWLRPHWDRLLESTAQVSALQTWEYLSTWYAHFGVMEQPFVVAVIRDGQPVALAPLQIAAQWRSGAHRRTLTFPIATAEAQVSRVLGDVTDHEAMSLLVDRILASDERWDEVDADVHATQDVFAALLRRRLRRHGCPVSTGRGAIEYRRNLEAFPVAGASTGDADSRFDIAPVTTVDALDRFFDLEAYAPDDEAYAGTCASSRHMSFYRALVASHSESLGVHLGILFSANERAAGLLGFLWRRSFHVTHVTRPERFAPVRAQDTALARLVDWCVAEGRCDSIEFTALSSLESVDVTAWAPSSAKGCRLRAHRASLGGWLMHGASKLS